MTLPGEKNSYLRKFGFRERSLSLEPHGRLGMIVVIPCFDEPDLVGCLESLRCCDRPERSVEVIVVVNDSESTAPSARERNRATLAEFSAWNSRPDEPAMRFHVIESLAQPDKHAGVGLSRKIGMDEAVRRLDGVEAGGEGIIVCFDADCRCDRNFLCAIERHFVENEETPGCSIYFEHSLDGAGNPEAGDAIAAYELHLRYYVDALRYAGFPGAYQTVGSSMAVRSWAYQKQGGMNRRQAGEDFYFLHRIIQLGGFSELNGTRVMPSARASHRVPFGTGRAVGDMLSKGTTTWETYPLRAFEDLRRWFELSASLRTLDSGEESRRFGKLSAVLRAFLDEQGFGGELEEMRARTTNEETFRKRFFGWFNAFRVMKYIHYARDNGHGRQAVEQAARDLLEKTGAAGAMPDASDTRVLLGVFRDADRRGWKEGGATDR